MTRPTAENDAARELIDRLAFTMFGGSRNVWDRPSSDKQHYLDTAGSLLPIVADVWQDGNDAGFSDGHSDVEPSRQTTNPYRPIPPSRTDE